MGLILSGGLRDNVAGLSVAHKQREKKEPKEDEKTSEELALERNQRNALNKEIEDSEEKFAALVRGKLGRASLLSGAPANRSESAKGSRGSGGAGGGGSLLSGGSSSGSSTGGGRVANSNRSNRGPVSRV